MACMTHYCRKCGHQEFSNDGGPDKCPWCNGPMRHFFDEHIGGTEEEDAPVKEGVMPNDRCGMGKLRITYI